MGRLEKKRLFVQVLLGVQMMVLIGCIDNVNGGPQVCKDRFPLGLATGRIQSHQISASTTFNASGNLHHFGVSQARLGVASFWCGSDKATWKEDWIQVNFDVTVNVTGIAVENGWYDNQNGILREFYLQFSSDGATFNNQTDGNGNTQLHELLTVPSRTQYFWFDAVPAKFIRIRASRLLVETASSRFCGRFEILGCIPSNRDDELYKIGLQRGIIKDLAITATSSNPDNPPRHARMNFPNSWCPQTNGDESIQIDFGQALTVKGIATQGHYGRLSTDMVSRYLVSFANNSAETFVFIQSGSQNKTFVGNNQTSEDPVFNTIEPMVIARYIRIHPLAGYLGGTSGKMCMRLEIYASHPGCNSDLSSSSNIQMYTVSKDLLASTDSNVDIYSNISWCAGSSAYPSPSNLGEWLRVDLGNIRLVTGIAISGSPNIDSWVTQFKLALGLLSTDLEVLGTIFKGSNGRTDVAVNWLESPKVARYLEIIPQEFIGRNCLRLRVLGCSSVPTTTIVPNITSITPDIDFAIVKLQTSGVPSFKAVHVTHLCSSCFTPITSIIPSNMLHGDAFNLTNLLPWTTYEIKFRYIFSGNLSLQSDAVNITTLETYPSKEPGSCNVTSVHADSIFVSWMPVPTNLSHGAITSYEIGYRKANLNGSYTIVATVSIRTHNITGLEASTDYLIQIKAVNKAGTGPPCVLTTKTHAKVSGGSAEDHFAMKSAIALITCSVAAMLIVLTCILTKASCEQMKHARGKRKCRRHMNMIRKKTLVEFLDKAEKSMDNAHACDSEKLHRMVRESRTSKISLPVTARIDDRSLKYFEDLRRSAQSLSCSRASSARSEHQPKLNHCECKQEDQMRKIGFDNSAFESTEPGERFIYVEQKKS